MTWASNSKANAYSVVDQEVCRLLGYVPHMGDPRKGKGRTKTGYEGPEGKQRYSSTLSLISALDGGGWLVPRLGRFMPSYRRLGGPQSRYREVRKISPQEDSIPGPSNQ
jgi:hypothetical protein